MHATKQSAPDALELNVGQSSTLENETMRT